MLSYELERTVAALITQAFFAAGAAPAPVAESRLPDGAVSRLITPSGAPRPVAAAPAAAGVDLSDTLGLVVYDRRQITILRGLNTTPKLYPCVLVEVADGEDEYLDGCLKMRLEIHCLWHSAEPGIYDRDIPGALNAISEIIAGAVLVDNLRDALNAARPNPPGITVLGVSEHSQGVVIDGPHLSQQFRISLLCASGDVA